jgi:GNAT superfamily N-acetyltransferase
VTIARRTPAECTPEEREAFSQLLCRAFGVGSGDRGKRIAAARCLILLREAGELVGIAALKAPTYSQRRAAFAKAGVPLLGAPPRHELGWVVVDERFRGQRYSRLLVESALQAAGDADVFATSHTENTPMHRTLRRSGFTAAGSPWFSRRHGRQLMLFVRPARPSEGFRVVT